MFFINGVKSEVLRAILDFMYMGEVHINNEDLVDFIEMAEKFKIRGVTKEQTVRIRNVMSISYPMHVSGNIKCTKVFHRIIGIK